MGLVAAKCTQCGANIEVDDTKEAGICKYCGTAFITEKAINNYNISAEKVIINGENINISNYDIESALKAVDKLIRGKLFDDAEQIIKQIIEKNPYDYRGWWEYTKFDYLFNDLWIDDNSKFSKAKALANTAGLSEITSYRDSEYNKIIENGKEIINFFENNDFTKLNFCYIKEYSNNGKHSGYIGLEIIDNNVKLVLYTINEKYGYIRKVIEPITIKTKIRGKQVIGQIFRADGSTEFGFHIKYPRMYKGESWVSISSYSSEFYNNFYISNIGKDGIIFNEQEEEMYYGNNLKNKSVDFEKTGGACYIATCVYGSYDCPQVWTLRRYRDCILTKTWFGRVFVKSYYAINPILVKWFGKTKIFNYFGKKYLDNKVRKLNKTGIKNTYYQDGTEL